MRFLSQDCFFRFASSALVRGQSSVSQRISVVSTVAAVLLFSSNLANAQDQRTDLTAGSIEISLVLPEGLQPFSEEKMALVREKGIAAKFIFSDAAGGLIAAINTFGSGASENGLTKVGDQIGAAAAKQGALVGAVTRHFKTMNGKKWLCLSFKEASANLELINDYFVTDWAGEYVLINFSSPTAKHENYKSAVERSARSVQFGVADVIEFNSETKSTPTKN